MKFLSYDTKEKRKAETEIRNAETGTVHQFVNTWVPDYVFRILRDTEFKYSLFPWDQIIKHSFVVGSPYRCYGAFTGKRLDGLVALGIDERDNAKISYIATAPWNYYKIGKMRGIGSGLVYFTISRSIYTGHEGEFILDALPDAEEFYEGIGMVATGNVNDEGLKEYFMSKDASIAFSEQFRKHLIEERKRRREGMNMRKNFFSKLVGKNVPEGPVETGQTYGLPPELVVEKYFSNRNSLLYLLRIYSEVPTSDLAERLGISEAELETIEKSDNHVPFQLVPKYAEIFDVDLKALLVLLGHAKGAAPDSTKKEFSELPLAAQYSGPELTEQEKVDLEELVRIILDNIKAKKGKNKV